MKKEEKYGYHKRKIQKGTLGEVSKIKEELEELEDAIEQNNPVMALVELSDMVGAIKSYLEKHHPSISLENLMEMQAATERAFKNGHRK